LGGDAFAILIENIEDNLTPLKTLECFKKVLDTSYITVNDHNFHLTFSAGIAIYPIDGANSNVLVKNADAALYAAKDGGRNTYRYYTNALTEKAFERVMMDTNLRDALEHNEFTLYYQPQYNTQNDKLIGMEALIRWLHPSLGMISPGNFIPILESSNLMLEVGKWILKTAFEQAVKWRELDLNPGVISINLSMLQLQSGESCVETIKELLKTTECQAKWIGLEITESAIMKEEKKTVETLFKLSDLGFTLSLDDFGTGYSSLSYLKKMPLHKIKIDKSFVDDLPNDGESAALSKTIISMAKNLDLKVIAEGVEKENQKEFLTNNGCYEIQGYLYSKPRPANEIENLLKGVNKKA
jgi:EAL domain-containing protein (putative c-di-GMP-specific phosphodiesterase class I)